MKWVGSMCCWMCVNNDSAHRVNALTWPATIQVRMSSSLDLLASLSWTEK